MLIYGSGKQSIADVCSVGQRESMSPKFRDTTNDFQRHMMKQLRKNKDELNFAVNATVQPLSAQKITKSVGEADLRPRTKGVCRRHEAGTSSTRKLTRAESAAETREREQMDESTSKSKSKAKGRAGNV